VRIIFYIYNHNYKCLQGGALTITNDRIITANARAWWSANIGVTLRADPNQDRIEYWISVNIQQCQSFFTRIGTNEGSGQNFVPTTWALIY